MTGIDLDDLEARARRLQTESEAHPMWPLEAQCSPDATLVLIRVARAACAASDFLDEHGKSFHCACSVPELTEAVAVLRGDRHG